MCTYFNLQQTLSRQSQEMTDIDSVIRIVGFSLLHLQANRLIVIQWISRKRGAKKTKSTAKMKDEQKEGKTEREINRYWKGEGRAGRTESGSERNDWHKMVLPCRPGPITTPLWNRYNDASFSVLYSCSAWWCWTSPKRHYSHLLLRLWTQTKDKNKGCVWVFFFLFFFSLTFLTRTLFFL